MNHELREYLKAHLKWGGLQGEERLRFLCLALAEETGELCGEVKKQWRGDDGDRRDLMIDELADCANYCFMIAMALGIDLQNAMLNKLKKVEQRPAWLAENQ